MVLLCKNKEEGGSARALPVAAPMPKSVSLLREKKESLDCLVLAYLFPLGWPCIYNVYCSQFEGCQDSLLLADLFFAFIERDIDGKRLLMIISFPI